MKVAQRAGLPIVPFTIDGTFRVYQQSKFAARPGPVRISFAAPISPNEASECSARASGAGVPHGGDGAGGDAGRRGWGRFDGGESRRRWRRGLGDGADRQPTTDP